MNPSRFDAFAKSIARQPSRRQMLRMLGGGGLLAAAGVGARVATSVSAQDATCTLAFNGTIRLGPTAGLLLGGGQTPGAFQAQMSFAPDAGGAFGRGQATMPDGTTLTLVGEAHGRALNLRIDLGDQAALVAVGTADQDLATCQGRVDGLLTGPQAGDLGDWHGMLATENGGNAATGAASVNQGASAAVTGAPPPNAPATMAPTGTMPPATMPPTMMPTATMAPTAPAPTATMAPPTLAPTAPPAPTEMSCDICMKAVNGQCVYADESDCGNGHICCQGMCIDPMNDNGHCGDCGMVCDRTTYCSGGTCVART